ncbi:MAG TPA: hypothetical protein VFU31_05090 [Candidatus Binatia bacterium]|nr:hypothetical protein [Candidatus Binatia bacterium]
MPCAFAANADFYRIDGFDHQFNGFYAWIKAEGSIAYFAVSVLDQCCLLSENPYRCHLNLSLPAVLMDIDI